MTPLEAAQRLVAHGLRDRYNGQCFVCGGLWLLEDPGFCPEIVKHLPTCPVPYLPGIVAALETAAADMAWVKSAVMHNRDVCGDCKSEIARACEWEGATVVPG